MTPTNSLAARDADVIVVGSGNAAFAAALTARERGATVLMLEKGSRDWIGGNSWFTAGAYRLAHGGLEDIRDLVGETDGRTELPEYSPAAYEADMLRVTGGRCDPTLTEILVKDSSNAARWLLSHGVTWRLMKERQSHTIEDGTTRYWGGLAVGTVGGGEGLIDAYLAASRRLGIELRCDTPVTGFTTDRGRVTGVVTAGTDGPLRLTAGAVVLASGGFEANADLRARHLGEPWRRAWVRGTPHNTGEALMAAIDLGADPAGDWEGRHAIAWDAAAPPYGDRTISNRFSRQAYPWGLVVNREGRRFLDEGADYRNYTYALYGAKVLEQPGGLAYQLFDANSRGFLNTIDYETAIASRFEAGTIEGLAAAAGIAPALSGTVAAYNAGVQPGHFDPTVLDGKSTYGVVPPKSNWAMPLDTPPFLAFAVGCGISFTFGGIRVTTEGRVLDRQGRTIPGLVAAGEVIGGLFHGNYPGGTGLASGAVFGRRAGASAASDAGRQLEDDSSNLRSTPSPRST